MAPLQFQPISSQPTAAFWSALTTLKLDKLKLDDTQVEITAWLEEGREIRDKEAKAGEGGSGVVGVDGVLGVGSAAFGEDGERPPPGSIPIKGVFKNFNTIEEFKSTETKKALFDATIDTILKSFEDETPNLNPFLLVTFADLKKYVYHHWFAFPALVAKPAWELDGELSDIEEEEINEIRSLESASSVAGSSNGFLVRGVQGQRQAAPISDAKAFFASIPEEDRYIVFHDPSSLPSNPGWPLRNILYYLAAHHHIRRINIICLRSGTSSRKGRAYQPDGEMEGKPQAVGWERNKAGKLGSRVVDLGSVLDPARLADQAVDLNLKLMRWRILPSLDLEKVAATKCLLLGAGTLGCYVSRCLMGWGIRNITFVDSAKVSFSNPVRQPLFEFEDCLNGGKPKAQCAADSLKRIFPGVNAQAHSFLIPMPGHPISQASEKQTAEEVTQLEELIKSHDAVFLLMDSRESRWLPTVIAASEGKIVINAALGFDSYLVMRHGGPPTTGEEKRLGCYYCNDVVAPMDVSLPNACADSQSLTDRTLDQMCTVTRPGIAPIAAASAVELLVSLVQHPAGVNAAADTPSTSNPTPESSTPLGAVPHQIRGQLASWKNVLVEAPAFDRCTGCSSAVVDEYRARGFDMLLRAFNEGDYLEHLTGLDRLQQESEEMMEGSDWDGSEDEDF